MKIMKKAFSLFLALAMTVGLAVTASAESPDISEYIHFDQDPVGVYELPLRVEKWVASANEMQSFNEVWTIYVYPDGTELVFDLPAGYSGLGHGQSCFEDGAFQVGGDVMDTEYETAFVLDGGMAEDVWTLWIMDSEGADIFPEGIHITTVSTAAQLPLRPVDGKPEEKPSGWAQGYVKEAVEANIVPEELQSAVLKATLSVSDVYKRQGVSADLGEGERKLA